jgi:hypothetical protein
MLNVVAPMGVMLEGSARKVLHLNSSITSIRLDRKGLGKNASAYLSLAAIDEEKKFDNIFTRSVSFTFSIDT